MNSKIIIDTDPGVDDALAIMLGIQKDLGIDSFCSVYGNKSIEDTTRNLLTILQVLNQTIPVYKGESMPLKGEPLYANSHGDNGLGGFQVEKLKLKSKDVNAVNFYINTLKNEKRKIVCLGPSTNIAKAIKQDYSVVRNIDELIVLGGVIDENGNVTDYSEFNVYNDPKSLDILLNSNLNITLIPINICRKVTLNFNELREISSSSQNKFVNKLAKGYVDYYTKGYEGNEFNGGVLYDVLPISYLINPDLFVYKAKNLEIDTSNSKYRGKTTIIDSTQTKNVNLITDIDAESVKILFINSIKNL